MPHTRLYGDDAVECEGSIAELPVGKLIEFCGQHRITGTLDVIAWGRKGFIRLQSGAITDATFAKLRGAEAVEAIGGLRDGLFRLTQALPLVTRKDNLAGQVSIRDVMRQCKQHHLSCRITIIHDREQALLVFHAGTIHRIDIDGQPVTRAERLLAQFEQGCVRIEALPFAALRQPPVSAPSKTTRPPSAEEPLHNANTDLIDRPEKRQADEPSTQDRSRAITQPKRPPLDTAAAPDPSHDLSQSPPSPRPSSSLSPSSLSPSSLSPSPLPSSPLSSSSGSSLGDPTEIVEHPRTNATNIPLRSIHTRRRSVFLGVLLAVGILLALVVVGFLAARL